MTRPEASIPGGDVLLRGRGITRRWDDVACVALNRLQPRYIRHEVDFAFYQTERERTDAERQIHEAVEFAFGFVQARTAMRARR